MSLLANSNAIESGGYNIDRSLRFRSSASAYLNRTPASAGNRQKWTWSGWIKKGSLNNGGSQWIWGANNTVLDSIVLDVNANGTCNLSASINSADAFYTTASYRDPSAWYHIIISVDTTQATASNRIIPYVNGVQVTSFSYTNYPSQNTNTATNAAVLHTIGRRDNGSNYFDGYLAEVNFIDGQALTPSSFGEFSTETGVWVPKKYTGTYGTNGFYLNFSDNTSATTLAYDKSGNGNNWTANNISTTAGATYDSMTDVPTLTSATAANYCVLNPLSKIGTPTNSGANLFTSLSASSLINGTQVVSSGKWYYEAQFTSGSDAFIGWNRVDLQTGTGNSFQQAGSLIWLSSNGSLYKDGGGGQAYSSAYTTADAIGCAIDLDNNQVTFYKNNVSQGTVSITAGNYAPCLVTGGTACNFLVNFGQRPFSYTPPTGFKALNTFNLPDPVIKKPNQYMDATTYTGNGGTQSVVNAGGFQPDLVWVKIRSNVGGHVLQDAVRGAGKTLGSQDTFAEIGNAGDLIGSFNSNGFQVNNTFLGGTDGSTNGTGTFVGWQWKESATAGFDIVTYTGTGVTRTVSHNLGVAPKMIIGKSRSGSGASFGWNVYHASLGNTGILQLNNTNAFYANSVYWNNTSPTSTNFTLGANSEMNNSGSTCVAYLFAEIQQFSKAFSFTGNGSADGIFVHLGFKPKLVLLKCSSTTGNWYMFDTVRNTYNVLGEQLYPNLSNAGSTVTTLDALSNGFKMRLAGDPNAAQTYIGFAWADVPFKFTNAF